MLATLDPFPAASPIPLEQLDVDELERRELALLAQATGDHLPAELADTVTRLRARRLTLEAYGE